MRLRIKVGLHQSRIWSTTTVSVHNQYIKRKKWHQHGVKTGSHSLIRDPHSGKWESFDPPEPQDRRHWKSVRARDRVAHATKKPQIATWETAHMLPVKNQVLNIDKNAAYTHRIPRIVPMVGYLTNHSVSTEQQREHLATATVYTVAVAKQHLLSRFSTALCAFVWCVSLRHGHCECSCVLQNRVTVLVLYLALQPFSDFNS